MNQSTLAETATKSIEDFKTLLRNQDAEIKKHGETTALTALAIRQKENEIQSINAELKAAQTRIDEMEKTLNRPSFGGGDGAKSQTPGELFVNSPEFKAMMDSGAKQSNPVPIGSTFFDVKETIHSGVGSAGVIVTPQRLSEIIGKALRAPRLRDLIAASPTNSNAIEYVEETELHQLHTTISVTVADEATSITVKNPVGFYAGQTVAIGTASYTLGVVNKTTGVIAIATVGGVVGGAAVGTPVTSNSFEATPEMSLKPNLAAKFGLKTVSTKTLAHGVPMTRQILEDAPRLRAHIDNRGIEGLKLEEERQFLYGSGIDNQLQGIMTHANVPQYKWSDGKTGDSKYDAIRRAMTIARLAGYQVSAIVLHPNDVEDLETTKGSDGHYIYFVTQQGATQTVWRVPYVETTAIKEGEFLVGAFAQACEIFDRMQAMVRISEHHNDYFMRNMIQILMEERLAFAIYRPQAFVKGLFDAKPA